MTIFIKKDFLNSFILATCGRKCSQYNKDFVEKMNQIIYVLTII